MVRGGALQLRLWITRATSIGLGRYSERHTSACMTQAGDSAMLMSWALRTGLWTVVVMLAVLSNVGVNITAFIASLGVGGIAVALAVQNILGNWFASLSIAVDQPFEVSVSYRTTPEQAEATAQIARRLVRTDDTLRFGRAPF